MSAASVIVSEVLGKFSETRGAAESIQLIDVFISHQNDFLRQ